MGAVFKTREVQEAALLALLREVPEEDRVETLNEIVAISMQGRGKVAAAPARKPKVAMVTIHGVTQRVVIAGAIRHPLR